MYFVSHQWQCKLHRANRKKVHGFPALGPSPWMLENISETLRVCNAGAFKARHGARTRNVDSGALPGAAHPRNYSVNHGDRTLEARRDLSPGDALSR